MGQPPQNGISIGSPVFTGHISVTNTQTDRQTTLRATSVAIGRIYDMHAMRPTKQAWQKCSRPKNLGRNATMIKMLRTNIQWFKRSLAIKSPAVKYNIDEDKSAENVKRTRHVYSDDTEPS